MIDMPLLVNIHKKTEPINLRWSERRCAICRLGVYNLQNRLKAIEILKS